MEKRMTEQELVASFDEALKEGHIFALYQPQINHSTGAYALAASSVRDAVPCGFYPGAGEK